MVKYTLKLYPSKACFGLALFLSEARRRMLKGLAICRLDTWVRIKFRFTGRRLRDCMGLEVALDFHKTANNNNTIQFTALMRRVKLVTAAACVM